MKKNYFTLLVCTALLFGCVSKKKFHKEQSRVAALQNDSSSTHSRLNTCSARLSELEKEKSDISTHLKNFSDSSQNALVNSNMTIADQEKRLKNLQALIQSQKDVL